MNRGLGKPMTSFRAHGLFYIGQNLAYEGNLIDALSLYRGFAKVVRVADVKRENGI